MTADLLLAVLIASPALAFWLCLRISWLNKIGTAALCFVFGVVLGQGLELLDSEASFRATAGEGLGVIIAFALPMLLFSSDIKAWLTLARSTMLSMVLAMLSVMTMTITLSLIFPGIVADLPAIAAMSVGNFTGSLVNGATIKTAIDASPQSFTLVYGYDVLISSLYLLFLITFAHRFAQWVLPCFALPSGKTNDKTHATLFEDMPVLRSLVIWRGLTVPLLINLGIIGITLLLISPLQGEVRSAAAIVLLTLLSLMASLQHRIRTTKGTYALGNYLILVFLALSGAMLNEEILEKATLALLLFFIALAAGAFLLHMLLCRLLRIDADTFLITSVASILSPPFVPLAASVMNNKTLLLSGISAGVLGYACGNLLGLATFWILQQAIPL